MTVLWNRNRLRGIAAAASLVLAAAATSAQEARPPQPVTVVTLQAADVTLDSELPGRVVALGVAEVRPQVSGIIVERLFQEGGAVAAGDPMYRIDDAIYKARVAQASASVAQAKATLTAAEKEEQRLAKLFQRGVASQQAIDDSEAGRDAARAGLLVAEAQLQAAEIDLEHTVIKAPLSGRVGRALTTQGALVTAQQAEPLAVIRQIERVYVDVTASTADVLRYTRARDAREARSAQTGSETELDPTVTLTLADGLSFGHNGTLLAAEPQVDPQTGVAVLRLQFPNPDELLLPGMYVKAHVPVGLARNVVLAPQQGVGRDRRGQPTALVVNDDNVVEARVLTVLGTQGSNWIVSEGLEPGDRLIVAGLQKTGPGATVAPQEQTPTLEAAED